MTRLALVLILASALPAAAEPFVLLVHQSPERIALRGGAAMVPVPLAVAGNLPEGALVLGGFFRIDAPSATVAQEWAAKRPAAATGAVELRAVVQMPGM